jgi:hypothetical protein
MYIESIAIQNLRSFKKTALVFQHPDRRHEKPPRGLLPNINLLLGSNGQGKSTLLRGIALGSIAPLIADSGYVPHSMVRREPETSRLPQPRESIIDTSFRLHHQDFAYQSSLPGGTLHNTRIVIEKKGDIERIRQQPSQGEEPDKSDRVWDQMFEDESPGFLIVGYGATRRVEHPKNYDVSSRRRMGLRYSRVAGLFEEGFSLIPLERWLPELESRNPGRYNI